MENVDKTQYQVDVAITGLWQGSSRTKLYEELGWESLLTVAGLDAFLRSIRLEITLPLFTSKKNYHHFVHPCIGLLKEKLPPLRTPMYRITQRKTTTTSYTHV